ncbi:hypothetical protein KC331_g16571 [Hortaea werneckii]|uniref:Uncharacterized protein n=1 Tax=Hortaea werneckii TaxID=91943 RepID=A0A3M7BTU1_HORWE|nr:hypothetical protein KC331_g16571 [Hortaea werneckii]KAI7699809.1 hypothetical protein KC353_g16251 [Hortaea werneckii]RMY43243.1 hypothetical protein D0865_11391 [Hortaea werneckii]
MGKRPFSELSVVATGVQSSEGRFGKRRRGGGERDDVPLISGWRCNLTALSQEHNLYFVAYGRDIYVYVPRFPTQAISRDPVLIVPSQPTSPGLRGYLDPHEPHSINHLIVQHLGRDEVIATVRDDGDVEAILVRHIVQAIRRRAEPDNAIGAVADEIKPIFQSNVGISAWGLAIHSEARIIATSSNAHEVRVFKFGLLHDVGNDDDEPSDNGEEEVSESDSTDAAGHRDDRRQMDVTQRVLNGDANIPYISFCNTGDDPEGRWLLTTDISGFCRVMDLHGLSGVDVTTQQFRFGRSWPGSVSGFDRLNAGWAIMFLDLRSFQPEREFQAAVGLPEDGTLPSSRDNNHLWDLSDTVETVAENSPAFVMNSPRRRRSRGQPSISSQDRNPAQRSFSEALQPGEDLQSPDGDVATPAHDIQTEAEPDALNDNENDNDDDDDDEGGGVPLENEEDEDVAMIDTGLDPAVEEIVLDVLDDLDGTATDSPDPESDEEQFYSDHPIALIGDGEDPDDEGTEDSISFNAMYGGKRLFGNQPYFLHQNSLCDGLPCPILHASVKNVYLLQPSPPNPSASNRRTSGHDKAANPFTPPMVGLANPLRQSIQNQFGYLNMYDRLNMHVYIPTLGVIILASQKGRALVLSLTKLPKGTTTSYPPEMRDHRRRTVYAMRVECILPFERQEKDGARPFAPLHGIAAAPVQGGSGPAEALGQGGRRWRVMLMYQDHSVLSYELRRQGDAGGGDGSTTVDFGQLVV